MAEDLTSYQAKAGRLQGGNAFYLKEDGDFQFYETDWTGAALENLLNSFLTVTYLGASGTGISGPATLSVKTGTYLLALPTGLSLASCNLPSAEVGARLILNGASMLIDANVIADASIQGNTLYGRDGATSLSSLNLSAAAYVELICGTAGVWSIVEANASVSERAIV